MKLKFLTISTFVLLGLQSIHAQQDDNIGTEVVNVVRPYTATISDAFKIKEVPNLEDEVNSSKQPIQYTINSYPVASTFSPAKGKAAGVDRVQSKDCFKNYATLGFGNYSTVLGEVYLAHEITPSGVLTGAFKHHSSQGGIDGVLLDDKFSTTGIDVNYQVQETDFSWKLAAGLEGRVYNWYGLDRNYFKSLDEANQSTLLNSIDPKQKYNNFYVGGNVDFNEGIFDGMSLRFNRFTDGYDSAENRFVAKPSIDLELDFGTVQVDFEVDYLSGEFKRGYGFQSPLSYGFLNFGVAPSIMYQDGDFALNAGLGLYFSKDNEYSDNAFKVYPRLFGSYKLVGDLMILYAAVEGKLKQNSYADITLLNPYVSPTLWIRPTDQAFEIKGGLKGKLAGNVSYNVAAYYAKVNDQMLFRFNNDIVQPIPGEQQNYEYLNSFQTLFDDVNTLGVSGEIQAEFSKNVTLGAFGEINTYSATEEAWNLPSVRFGATTQLRFADRWNLGVQVFYVGERKDQITSFDIISELWNKNVITLDGYFDANAHLMYQINDRFSVFIKANNFTGQSYMRWNNYPTQQFQGLLGLNYKFDF